MSVYDLPSSLTIGGRDYPIRYQWRAVMDIFSALNDPELDEIGKMDAMLTILFPDWENIPQEYTQEAIEKAVDFLNCGRTDDAGKQGPRLFDWEQDAHIILPEINKAAGFEVRSVPDVHWWTFFGWFMGIDGGLFGSVLHIRQKKAKGKKLDKWEQEYYKENRGIIDLREKESQEIREEKEKILSWL